MDPKIKIISGKNIMDEEIKQPSPTKGKCKDQRHLVWNILPKKGLPKILKLIVLQFKDPEELESHTFFTFSHAL